MSHMNDRNEPTGARGDDGLAPSVARAAAAGPAQVQAAAMTPARAAAVTRAQAEAMTPVQAEAMTPVQAEAMTPVQAAAMLPVQAKTVTPAQAAAMLPARAAAGEPLASAAPPVSDALPPPSLEAIRRRLAGARGPAYWRSLEELAGSAEFQEVLRREFPAHASEWDGGLDRRRFLQLAGASLGLAGLTACTRQPLEKIVPYVKQPEQLIPGMPLFFATAMTLGGYALGLLVESHEGRPTKIEGNPEHPASLGATDVFAQAALLGLYDPDRSQVLTQAEEIQTWAAFVAALRAPLRAQASLRGEGLRILTETITSPTLADQMRVLRTRFPLARWHQYEPAGRDAVRLAAQRAFGRPVATRFELGNADVIVALDADFLASGPGSVRHARQFAERRRAPAGTERAGAGAAAPASMSRFYAIEATPTATGTLADHRLALAAGALPAFTAALAAALEVPGAEPPAALPAGNAARWIAAVASDLRKHAGRSLVIAGEWTSPDVQVLAHAINQRLGNVGTTVIHTEPVEAEPSDQLASLRELAADMTAGRVEILAILGGNPVFNAPADLGFGQALLAVPLRIHLSMEEDETSELCQWHIPEAHFLETWSDARAYDGTASVMQPLIEPLYGGKSAHEVLSVFTDDTPRSGHDLVRSYWTKTAGEAGFESIWRKALHDGLVAGTALPATAAVVADDAVRQAALAAAAGEAAPAASKETPAARARATAEPAAQPTSAIVATVARDMGATALPVATVVRATEGGNGSADAPTQESAARRAAGGRAEGSGAFELVFRPDPTIHDGRFANNGWLQELPKPLTKLTWDNAACLAPADAERLGLVNGDVVAIDVAGRPLQAPVWILPGQTERTVSVHFGYGRRRSGRVGTGTGIDAYAARTSEGLWLVPGVALRKTGETRALATTQEHFGMEGRDLVRTVTLAELAKDPETVKKMGAAPPRELNMFAGFAYEGHAWGMAVDLGACVGCGACVVACQAENNIPVVGKDQVLRGREMHWLRIDRYYAGSPDAPEALHQPVMCMHCEQAPCEVVCPVGATNHSSEGLNDMVYNRCVGTRYCSNNCPYKVRRFNFLQYNDDSTSVLKLLRNPDVTVRSRGVMEKCTYCVQRINAVRIESEKQDRPIRDGEIQTACQQACPTQAIVFGDINDPDSRVSRMKADPKEYGLLEELNTRPRTTYLAKVRNPNPELEPAQARSQEGLPE